MKLLRDPHPQVRSASIETLVSLAPLKEIVGVMIDCLGDVDPYVRQTAVKALGQLHDHRSLPPLIDTFVMR